MRKISPGSVSLLLLAASVQGALAGVYLAEHPCNSQPLYAHYLEADSMLQCAVLNPGRRLGPGDKGLTAAFANNRGDIKGLQPAKDLPDTPYKLYAVACRPAKTKTGEVTLAPHEQALFADALQCSIANGVPPAMAARRAQSVMRGTGAVVQNLYCRAAIAKDFTDGRTGSGDGPLAARRKAWIGHCEDAVQADAREFFHDDQLARVPPGTKRCNFSGPLLSALGIACPAGR